jgi:multidrug transporter EmrE-like cation transporter
LPPFFLPNSVMKTQNYENHTRIYPLHHLVITPLTLIFLGWTVYRMDFSTAQSIWTSVYFLLGAVVIALISLLTRIYAIKSQNRTILVEMRQRYFHLTGSPFYTKEIQLSEGQIIALRFAGDEELVSLIERAITENLSPKDIKLAIKNWQGDYRRV